MADHQSDGPAALANEWLATVKDRAMTRAKAEVAGTGAQFSAEQLELVEIGILAGASEMLGLIEELRLRPDRSD